jgi:type IV pilus assembly protein PilA
MFSSAIRRLNDRRDGAGDVGEDAGFTLIELMVVLLILAILLAIAIPTFLGVTKSANDRAAQSNLNTAMVNAKAAYQSNAQSYGAPNTVNSTVLKTAEPGLNFTTSNSPNQGTVSVFSTTDGNAIVLAAFTKSNNCFYQIDNPSGNTQAPVAATPFSSATPTGTNGTTVTPAAAAVIVFSNNTPGTIYAEVKGDATAADCNASAPVYNGTGFQWSTTAFPAL